MAVDDEAHGLPRYEVLLTEPAEIDIDLTHRWLREHISLEYADRWQDGLLTALLDLSYLPNRHAIAPENDIYDVTVRRLLYFGPNRRRSGSAYRVLYHIVEPQAEGELGIVRDSTFGTAHAARSANLHPHDTAHRRA